MVLKSKQQTESSASKRFHKQTGLQRQTPSQTREVSRRIRQTVETVGSGLHLKFTIPSTIQRLLDKYSVLLRIYLATFFVNIAIQFQLLQYRPTCTYCF